MLNHDPGSTASAQKPADWQSPPSAIRHLRPQQRIESTSLLQGSRELLIAHVGEEYRLRLTRNDKLILTK